MRLFALVIACCAATLIEAAEAQLCIAGSVCRDYVCGMPVDPIEKRRAFTLTGSAGQEFTLGILHPHDTAIACAARGEFELRVAARKFPRGQRVGVTVTSETEDVWQLQVSENQAYRIQIAPGTYRVAIASSHFKTIRKTIHVGRRREKIVAQLEPLPVLTGRIIDIDGGRGIAGAIIRTDLDGDSIVADATGRFTIEADPENWPKNITVEAAGYSATTAVLPAARTSTSLDEIRLSRGRSIVVALEANSPAEVMELELQKVGKRGRAGRAIKTLQVPKDPGAASLKFENVEPGEYIVLAKGDESWKRKGVGVTVLSTETAAVALRIEPFSLRVRAQTEGLPIAKADIRVTHKEAHWTGQFTTNGEGVATVELWQGGDVTTMLRAGVMPYVERRTLIEGQDADWLIDVPSREITGVVIDAANGSPIAHAAIGVHVVSTEGYGFSVSTNAEKDGSFRLTPVPHGKHTLSVAARGYPPTELAYVFLEPEQSRNVTVRLERGTTVRLKVVDTRGVPIVGARVLDFLGLAQTGRSDTDASGTASVMIRHGETRDVYVIGRDGSFAFLLLTSGMENPSLRIPEGSSRIVLRTESESNEPIPNVSVVVRHNGRVLPFEVIHALASVQGSRTTSGATGRIVFDHMPAGLYEFWPVGSPAELRAVAAGAGPDAPVKMVVAPGENVAVMTFARR